MIDKSLKKLHFSLKIFFSLSLLYKSLKIRENEKNVAILYHMSALLLCRNNFSKMVKSGRNVLPYDAESSNFA